MDIHLIRATKSDARELWQMQLQSFAELLERYQDFGRSPGDEPLEKTMMRIEQPFTYFYFICAGEIKVGAIRIVDKKEAGKRKRLSPLFILPKYRGRGYAQRAIELCEQIHGSADWELDTILQEKGNCHLYEKMGYQATDELEEVNDKMTLVMYRK